jgi:hypothetical protein
MTSLQWLRCWGGGEGGRGGVQDLLSTHLTVKVHTVCGRHAAATHGQHQRLPVLRLHHHALVARVQGVSFAPQDERQHEGYANGKQGRHHYSRDDHCSVAVTGATDAEISAENLGPVVKRDASDWAPSSQGGRVRPRKGQAGGGGNGEKNH